MRRHAEEERDALMARLEKQVASTRAGRRRADRRRGVGGGAVTAAAQSTIARLQDLWLTKPRVTRSRR